MAQPPLAANGLSTCPFIFLNGPNCSLAPRKTAAALRLKSLAIAHIVSGGEFSVFAGVDRVITLLEGGFVQLSSAYGSVLHALDTPLQPFGDAKVRGSLLDGDCHDLNVMTPLSQVASSHL
jgi:environmental stress-induced protein Ves